MARSESHDENRGIDHQWDYYPNGLPPDWDVRRKLVFERDCYECQQCGDYTSSSSEPQQSLHAHHKEPITQGGDHTLDNLITLCQECYQSYKQQATHKRDKYTCQICNVGLAENADGEITLQTYDLNSFEKSRNDESTKLITICTNCLGDVQNAENYTEIFNTSENKEADETENMGNEDIVDDFVSVPYTDFYPYGYPPDWDTRRKVVYERDDYTCQECGVQSGPYREGDAIELHAHHIKPISHEPDHRLNNIITLCENCHFGAHEGEVKLSCVDEEKWSSLADTTSPNDGDPRYSGIDKSSSGGQIEQQPSDTKTTNNSSNDGLFAWVSEIIPLLLIIPPLIGYAIGLEHLVRLGSSLTGVDLLGVNRMKPNILLISWVILFTLAVWYSDGDNTPRAKYDTVGRIADIMTKSYVLAFLLTSIYLFFTAIYFIF